ncbi:MAG: HEAT repeat domain-containing protein [Planctomycetaceae bacterium]
MDTLPEFLFLERGCPPMRWTDSLSLTLLFAAVVASPLYAQRDLKEIPIPDPELERATFVLPEGFEVNLFAADPMIAKPIQMNFDPQGRLWIVSSEVYPHIEPGKKPTDKVLVLEDKDGDGVSDVTHVFAEGLLIPTGIEPGDGGAYVGASTELIHFKDTNGDLKADEERVVLSGFGTEDTHHILHTLRWGPEQRLYMSQSIYIHSHIETPWGVKRLNAGGIWQFRPDSLKLNVFARGLVNTWGTHFDKYGATFATDGAGGEGINYMIPGGYYVTAYGAERLVRGLNPGSPKHCGLEIVYSEHLPDDWRGSAITNDFRGHRVCRFVLTPDGSGFVSQQQQEVIKSNHPAFRPIDVKIGPDGAIYIADWYNPIIQHGEVDFRDPRRDHTHGRIWRVTYKGKPLVERPQLVTASNAELCKQLESPNIFNRTQAKRVLKERGPEVLDDVKAWLAGIAADHPEKERLKLESLWLYVAFDHVDREALYACLNSPNADVRAAATRIAGDWNGRLGYEAHESPSQHSKVVGLLATRAVDESPRVRLEAIRALAKIPDARSIEFAAQALSGPPTIGDVASVDAANIAAPLWDEWLDYSLWLAARELRSAWQPSLIQGDLTFDGDAKQLAFVISAAGSAETVSPLVDMVTQGKLPAESQPRVLDVIANFAAPQQLRTLFDVAVKTDDAGQRHRFLATLLNAQQSRKAVPPGPFDDVARLLDSDDETTRAYAVRLVGAWKLEGHRERIRDLIANNKAPQSLRLAAVDGIAYFGDQKAAQQLCANGHGAHDDMRVEQAAVERLIPINPELGAGRTMAMLRQDVDGSHIGPIMQVILSKQPAIEKLTEGLTNYDPSTANPIEKDAAIVALRVINSSGKPQPALADALRKASGVSTGPKPLNDAEMAEMVAFVTANGDPHRGETVYRRAELSCIKCHAIGNAGGQIGPNMLSLGATAQLDYIIQSLLDPAAKVKEGFHTVVLVDDDGNQHSGIKLRETGDAVFLRDAEGKEKSVLKSKIEVQSEGVSLMPAGLTDKLTKQELADLTSFLSALGRLPEFTIGQQQLARKWQVMQSTDSAAYQLRRISYAAATTDNTAFQWTPVYSTVNGQLPLSDLPEVFVKNRSAPGVRGMSFVRCLINVTSDGPATLKLNDIKGRQLWLDADPLEIGQEIPVQLTKGQHQITIAVDRSEGGQPFTLELTGNNGTFVGDAP